MNVEYRFERAFIIDIRYATNVCGKCDEENAPPPYLVDSDFIPNSLEEEQETELYTPEARIEKYGERHDCVQEIFILLYEFDVWHQLS